ncbi:hypothetical protein CHS0354_031721 [Potamilus streckersoni]|uniref:Uncharacterized protein n=1 Tax=Potamilus streckersoni TaxID=2493646 RepID=A0AAE0TC94_9BIVA|nr:hypothetical protein CHS0354_031721 [Potamilus streckersoni]
MYFSVDKCANCYGKFEKKKSGYRRFSLETSLRGSNTLVREAISTITGVTFESAPARCGFFLCHVCWRLLSIAIQGKENLKTFCTNTNPASYIGLRAATQDSDWSSVCQNFNQPSTSTQQESESQQVTEHNYIKGKQNNQKDELLPVPIKQRKNAGHRLDKAAGYIKNSEYPKAYRKLFNATKTSRQQFLKFICKRVRNEVRCLCTSTTFPLFNKASASNLRNFSWDSTIDQLAESAPVLYSALVGVITDQKDGDSLKKKRNINPKVRLGIALSCLLYTKYPRKASFIPSVYSAQFSKIRKLQAMKYLYRAGLCTQAKCATAALNTIGNDFEMAAKTVFEMGKADDGEEEMEEEEEESENNYDTDDTDDEESGSDDNEMSKEDDEDNDVSNGEEVDLDEKQETFTMLENGN